MTRGIHWFRNDLRLMDNLALDDLFRRVDEWLPVFVFDRRIARTGRDATARDRFLWASLERLARRLASRGATLLVRTGLPERVIADLVRETGATVVSFNEDTTPFAARRDAAVVRAVRRAGAEVASRRDRTIFAPHQVRTASGSAYSVYTPYRRRWWQRWNEEPKWPIRMHRMPPPIPRKVQGGEIPPERDVTPQLPTAGEGAARRRLDRFLETAIARYPRDRDFPAVDGTSRLAPYLRFGAISVRQCFERAFAAAIDDPRRRAGVEKWLDEFIWREFYAGILEENPRLLHDNFQPATDGVRWLDDPAEFEAWCEGRTGYPIVDAGMRQLVQTGWMHNRVRMIVASFLTKDLLVDWRKGERFFFLHLLDGDPASNNGGWQWAASTGTDAQPYFRIFNPVAQGRRWDAEGEYVRRFVPELSDVPLRNLHEPWKATLPEGYPAPIVDHDQRRKLALARFREARSRKAAA